MVAFFHLLAKLLWEIKLGIISSVLFTMKFLTYSKVRNSLNGEVVIDLCSKQKFKGLDLLKMSHIT